MDFIKPVNLKPYYVGDPINAIKIFNDKVDELLVLDITATKLSKDQISL